ncbi:MAG: hypothetical protein AAB431_03780 [Patescibacteria group bacterium]
MINDSSLRKKLDEFLSQENEQNWWKPELFEASVRDQLPKELEILSPPPAEQNNYNCFVYALGLEQDRSFLGNDNWNFTKELDQVYEEMMSQNLLTETQTPTPGDLIVYRTKEGVMSHVGRVKDNGVIISKWSWGPLLKHAVLAVPASYGDDVRYYKISDEAKQFVIKQRNV